MQRVFGYIAGIVLPAAVLLPLPLATAVIMLVFERVDPFVGVLILTIGAVVSTGPQQPAGSP